MRQAVFKVNMVRDRVWVGKGMIAAVEEKQA